MTRSPISNNNEGGGDFIGVWVQMSLATLLAGGCTSGCKLEHTYLAVYFPIVSSLFCVQLCYDQDAHAGNIDGTADVCTIPHCVRSSKYVQVLVVSVFAEFWVLTYNNSL